MRFSSRLAIALIALLYTSSIVQAQADGPAAGPASENPETLEEARRAFEEGIALAAQERWFDAAAAFRRSRQHMERPSTLFNLASVLFRLGSFVEADRALTDYFAIATADDKQRAEAERLQGLVRESLVPLELSVAPSDATVQIDAKEQAGEGAVRKIVVDPGSHVIAVSREGYVGRTERVEAQASKPLSLDIRLEAVPVVTPVAAPAAALAPTPAREPRDDDDGFFEEPVVWIIGGAIIVAAAVTTGVLLASGDDEKAKPFAGSSNMTLVAEGSR